MGDRASMCPADTVAAHSPKVPVTSSTRNPWAPARIFDTHPSKETAMQRLALAAALALCAPAAFAAPAPAPAPSADARAPAAMPPADASERVICVRERTLGSNRIKRVCRTAAQMATDSEDTRDALIRSHTTTAPPPQGGGF